MTYKVDKIGNIKCNTQTSELYQRNYFLCASFSLIIFYKRIELCFEIHLIQTAIEIPLYQTRHKGTYYLESPPPLLWQWIIILVVVYTSLLRWSPAFNMLGGSENVLLLVLAYWEVLNLNPHQVLLCRTIWVGPWYVSYLDDVLIWGWRLVLREVILRTVPSILFWTAINTCNNCQQYRMTLVQEKSSQSNKWLVCVQVTVC
jgi:hypothetical protein